MKQHIIPYLTNDDNRWAGINITNIGKTNTSVMMEYHRIGGTILKIEELYIDANKEIRFFAPKNCAWVRAVSSDDIILSEFIGNSTSSTTVPVEKLDITMSLISTESSSLKHINNTTYCRNMCKGECEYFKKPFIDALEIIGRFIAYKYSDRVAKQLEIIDGSPLAGWCPNHPAGVHSGGIAADLHYYIFADTNHTQKGVDTPDNKEPVISIWNEPNTDIPDPSVFDVERNVDLVIMINKLLPKSSMIMDERIVNVLKEKAIKMYGSDINSIMNCVLISDSPYHYNHHTHTHVTFGNDNVNWDIVIK